MLQNPKKPLVLTAGSIDPHRREILEDSGLRIKVVAQDRFGRLDLEKALACLGRLGITSVMVEGGARVITSFLTRRLVDLVILTIVPVFLGGLKAVGEPLIPEAHARLAQFPFIKKISTAKLGKDLVLWGKLAQGQK
jgi:riboflavin biosynthesis pyrimidine reductase